ncbi:MAG TPA: T9SS type A sorting domain-containing protein [Bacteroidales bacterium]|nr:T9SS type A sorting domain-containing protein [Bacteroidales bacterium]
MIQFFKNCGKTTTDRLVKLIPSVFFLFLFTQAGAQQATVTAGGNASGIGGTASYSVGQIVYTTNTGTNGSVAQGVQQPFEISIVTGIEQAEDIHLLCAAYPNPATEILILSVENYNNKKLFYQLYDIYGKLLENKTVSGSKTPISLENLAPASYILKLTDDNKEIKVFKIIKTQ